MRIDHAMKNQRTQLLIIYIVATILILPSLWTGFLFDDFISLIILDGKTVQGDTSASLFVFVPSDPESTARIIETGLLPWWTYDGLKIVFWRPLSELLVRIDHALFGHAAWVYHVHSFMWWMFTLVAAALLLRRALPGAAGLLALLIFALDECHVLPVAWVANRNALVSVAPAFLGLWGHIKWREENWRPGRALSLAGFGIGLTGGETALCVLAYVFAYEVFGPSSPSRKRVLALAPMAVLVAAYVVANRLGGAGVTGCGVYIDPASEPLRYLSLLPERIPTLLGGGIFGVSANWWLLVPEARLMLAVIGACGAVLFLILLRSAWKKRDPETKEGPLASRATDFRAGPLASRATDFRAGLPASRATDFRAGLLWLLPGSVLALFPIAASFPSDRLLLAPALGFSAGLAVVILHAWRSRKVHPAQTLVARDASRPARRFLLIGAGMLLAAMHLLLVPLSRLYLQVVTVNLSRNCVALAKTFPPGTPSHDAPRAVLLNGPDHVVGVYLPVLLIHFDKYPYSGWHTLSLAKHDHRFIRSGPRSLTMEIIGGTMMHDFFEQLYRPLDQPLRPGDTFDRGVIRAEVLDATEKGPTRVEFHFDRDFDDPSLHVMAWVEGEIRTIDAPAVGDTLVIERTLGPAGF